MRKKKKFGKNSTEVARNHIEMGVQERTGDTPLEYIGGVIGEQSNI
jgi:hypothetical protein